MDCEKVMHYQFTVTVHSVLLICQFTLTAGILICCLHSGTNTQREITRLSCVSYLFRVNGVSFNACSVEWSRDALSDVIQPQAWDFLIDSL